MKPTKNRVFCKDCGRLKMLFETEKKANTFIKFNSDEIEEESGFKPERSYNCIYCGGWHITSRKENIEIKSKTEFILEKYNEEKGKIVKLQEAKSLVIEKKQDELREILTSLEKEIQQLNDLELNPINFRETLQSITNKLEEIKDYKKFPFKGSNKRIKNAQEKFILLNKQKKS